MPQADRRCLDRHQLPAFLFRYGPAMLIDGRRSSVVYYRQRAAARRRPFSHRERELARATGAMNLAQLLAWARQLIAAVAA
jgi:hypothetical protein